MGLLEVLVLGWNSEVLGAGEEVGAELEPQRCGSTIHFGGSPARLLATNLCDRGLYLRPRVGCCCWSDRAGMLAFVAHPHCTGSERFVHALDLLEIALGVHARTGLLALWLHQAVVQAL